ncbi:MAG: ATP-binding protein [Candidatus Micrarchaeales archaeon]|nr:ATP-binding protein [Candidatus Micrarchaeales archaeon]
MLDEANITKLIKDFYENGVPTSIFRRELELQVDLNIKRALTVIGPRRAGKSYLLFYTINKLVKEGVDKTSILYLNFEDPAFESATHLDLGTVLDIYFKIYPDKHKEKIWLFFDEIQEIDGWERFVRSTMDKVNAQIFLTGSSSKLLSREIATSMRGRTLSYLLLTLSFPEFLEFNGIEHSASLSSSDESRISKSATEYLEFGGYPETVLYKKERKRILSELLDVTLQRDIVERYGVRNIKVLRLLIKTIATSSEFSIHKFFNFLKSNSYKVSKNTLYAYLQALTDAFVVHEIKKYSKSLREGEQSLSKFYMLDNGLLSINSASESKLFENAVFNTLYRRNDSEIFYYKDQSYEIDFVACENGKAKALIQASYDIDDIATREREFKALTNASNKLKCKNLIVVTQGSKRTETFKGKRIRVVPLWEFMLSDKI